MSEENFFGEAKAGKRFLILNRVDEQKFPEGPLQIVKAEKRKSATGSTYPVLTLEAEDGTEYESTAWQRDVLECLEEFGGGHPTTWGKVRIVVQNGRGKFVPNEKLSATTIKQERVV